MKRSSAFDVGGSWRKGENEHAPRHAVGTLYPEEVADTERDKGEQYLSTARHSSRKGVYYRKVLPVETAAFGV